MRKMQGFTLIELVIVIIILGILAATAVPKFINLQSDARAAALGGVKGALEGAATIVYSKSAIDGEENQNPGDVDGIATVYGYPAATAAALREAASLSDNDWVIDVAGSIAYISAVDTSAANGTCDVSYEVDTSASRARPTILVNEADKC